ncbi:MULTISPECIES: methylated-DNA--[protein]-cysteine S-methyltransferase [Aminobacterium]|jgi:methylated-DNA-[protein]-cysteine S-methyltransferase|uniref:methylated-DNA--[protein]-cysteine S-methyltransferase n=1 Tax=Aminobacterium TaxID=81466 RepID=UPI002579EF0A|nr:MULTISPECIES: MGMT family protein [unclassified Aminobacterium]
MKVVQRYGEIPGKQWSLLASPLGNWIVEWCDDGVISLSPNGKKESVFSQAVPPIWVTEAWKAFWEGNPFYINLCQIAPLGTFSMRVLEITSCIPRGAVKTYQEIASLAGNPDGARAAGNALRRNPWPLFVPCHRVIRKDGRLGGYAGLSGTDLKRRLLQYEMVPGLKNSHCSS